MKTRKHIAFDSDRHVYINTITKVFYTSITRYISQFHKPFDAQSIATNLVLYNSKYQAIYSGWNTENAIKHLMFQWKQSANVGILIHQILEDHCNGKTVLDESKGLQWNDRIIQLLTAWKQLDFHNVYKDYQLLTEHLVFHDKLKIAGQCDLVFFDHEKKTFAIADYKTNRKGINYCSYKGELMYYPYNHLEDCNFNHYTLQLNYYRHCIESETKYKCEKLMLIWIDTNHEDCIKIEEIELPSIELNHDPVKSHSYQSTAGINY